MRLPCYRPPDQEIVAKNVLALHRAFEILDQINLYPR